MLKKTVVKEVMSLALPAVGEMILYMMIWVFDTLMVGKYGGNVAVSTVGLSSELMYTLTGIFIDVGISVGVASLIARNVGAKRYNKAEEYAALGVVFGAALALLISAMVFIFCENILIFSGAEGEVITYGAMFMRITSFGIFFNMIANVFSAILRGNGDTRTPFFVSLASSWLIRLPLMYYFVYVVQVSVVYVWWITAVQWIFDGLLLLILFKKRFKKINYARAT